MPTQNLSGKITGTVEVAEDGAVTMKVAAFDMGAAPSPPSAAEPPDLDKLLKAYSEVGSHDRHFSAVRMTATSLLFTIAVLIGKEALLEADHEAKAQFLRLAAIVFFVSLLVNLYYARLSRLTVEIERHIENWMAYLRIKDTVPAAVRPSFDWRHINLRDVMHRRFYWFKRRVAPVTPPDALTKEEESGSELVRFIREFQVAFRNAKPPRFRRCLDGPFWLVLVAILVYLALARWYIGTYGLKLLPGSWGLDCLWI